MAIYTTKHRTVEAEQFTGEAAAAYSKWHIDGEQGDAPLLPEGIEYAQHSGFSIETPNKGRIPVTIGSYVVRENGEVRVEGAMAFETVFMPAPPIEAMPREQWDAPAIPFPPELSADEQQAVREAVLGQMQRDAEEAKAKVEEALSRLPPPEAMHGAADQFPGTDDPFADVPADPTDPKGEWKQAFDEVAEQVEKPAEEPEDNED